MGYFTHFSLNFYDPSGQLDFPDVLKHLNDEVISIRAFEDDGTPCEAVKWYNHEYDMAQLSLRHPDVIFFLEGIGENPEDLWRKYFLNGRMQLAPAKIHYDEFDPSKLKDIL